MAVSPAWFGRNRGLAIGIISAGTGIGGLVWAPAITASIQEMGFRNTLRLTSALETTLGCIAAFSLSWEPSVADAIDAQKVATSRSKRMLNISFPTWHTMRQRKFIAQALSAAFQSAAYYTPTFFIVSYAKTLAYDDATGANVTAASNACNAIGKIIAGVVADRIGRLNSLCLTSIASAAASALWIGSTISGTNDTTTGRALFLSFTVSYSLFASAYVSLFPPTLGDVFGIQEMPRIMGFMFMMQGIAAMVGTPVAGILTHSKGMTMNSNDYVGMASLVTGLMFAAAVAAVWVKLEEDL
jgi:MFS family permease